MCSSDLYGDYQLVLDALADRLLELRAAYAATLDDEAAVEYEAAFDRAAAKRFPRLGDRL